VSTSRRRSPDIHSVDRPAPQLDPVAAAWFDTDESAHVCSDDGRRFWLRAGDERTPLVALAAPADDPDEVAAVLAAGLAGCDLPPDGAGIDHGTADTVLRNGRVGGVAVAWDVAPD